MYYQTIVSQTYGQRRQALKLFWNFHAIIISSTKQYATISGKTIIELQQPVLVSFLHFPLNATDLSIIQQNRQ